MNYKGLELLKYVKIGPVYGLKISINGVNDISR